ncbi:MAG: hypothetical protein IT289_05060 [Oligoflexia bacterium]|nr:hypothetical protein [Oligoflexia bacterium]
MVTQEPLVTQSKFYHEAFNTAIIDGPLRLYFSDTQESEALKLYFDIQERLLTAGLRLRELPLDIPNMIVMLYPSTSLYEQVFANQEYFATEPFGAHFVLGVVNSVQVETNDENRLEAASLKVCKMIQGLNGNYQACPII